MPIADLGFDGFYLPVAGTSKPKPRFVIDASQAEAGADNGAAVEF
jgi:hypothetical protein